MIAKVCDRESRRDSDTWFENCLVSKKKKQIYSRVLIGHGKPGKSWTFSFSFLRP